MVHRLFLSPKSISHHFRRIWMAIFLRFRQKNHNCAKNLDNKSFSFINVLTKYSTILSNACLIQANYLKVRVLFWKKKTTLTCNALKTTFPSRFFSCKNRFDWAWERRLILPIRLKSFHLNQKSEATKYFCSSLWNY